MKRTKNELKIIFIVLTTVTVLSVIVAAGFAALYFAHPANPVVPTGGTSVSDTESEDAVETTPDTAASVIDTLQKENDALRAETGSLLPEPEQMKEDLAAAETEFLPADTVDLAGTFDPGDITPADPDSLSYTFDLTGQLTRIKELETRMALSPFIIDPDGNLVKLEDVAFDEEDEETEIIYRAAEHSPLDADGKPVNVEIDYEAMGYTYPVIAISYRDLERGTVYAYNGDEVYFSASLIKAPYVYALLRQFAQYNEIKKANPTNDPAVGKTLSEETLEKYDFARKITVTKDRVAEGSGKIKDMDLSGGKEFTVLELIEYAIKVSDNTAFRILRDEFGYDCFWSESRGLGIKSVFESFNKMTANEACLYLAAIYDFAKEYPEEGGMLIALMKQANHQVLIPMAVDDPYNVAHKYGWDEDSYHDMAIVYGDAPFAVCVMTNFNFGTNDDDINEYIRSLVAEIEDIHFCFYNFGKE